MRGSRPDRSTLSRSASAAPPGGRSSPAESSSRAPSAWAMPAPASFVALPPMPRMNRLNPESRASRMACPRPYVVATSGLRSSTATSARPDVRAISITAVRPSPMAPQTAVRVSPSGPITSELRISPPEASTSVSRVPSPPSATGASSMTASGETRRTPSAIISAARSAEMLPLNACGAMTIFIEGLRTASRANYITRTPSRPRSRTVARPTQPVHPE